MQLLHALYLICQASEQDLRVAEFLYARDYDIRNGKSWIVAEVPSVHITKPVEMDRLLEILYSFFEINSLRTERSV